MHIGRILRKRRKELRLSQEYVALECGLSPMAYYEIEAGRTREPRLVTLGRIARVLNMPEEQVGRLVMGQGVESGL